MLKISIKVKNIFVLVMNIKGVLRGARGAMAPSPALLVTRRGPTLKNKN